MLKEHLYILGGVLKTVKDIFEYMSTNTLNFIEYVDINGKLIKKNFQEVYDNVIETRQYLETYHIEQNAKIGVICSNRYEFVLLDLACIMGGYHFISFHYGDFKEQIEYSLKQYHLDLLFVEDELVEPDKMSHRIISIDEVGSQIDKEKSSVRNTYRAYFRGDQIFSTIFTGGSTGLPKGIEVKYNTVEHFVKECISCFDLSRNDLLLVFLPMSQYSSRGYIYGAFILGMNIALSSPDKLNYALKCYKPTVFQAVPYLYEKLYDNFIQAIKSSKRKSFLYCIYKKMLRWFPASNLVHKCRDKLFGDIYSFFGGRVKYMVTGSAPIRKNILQFFYDLGLPLYESYGLVETGVITLNYPGCHKIGSVGKVLSDKTLYFDENKQIIVKSPYLWGDKYLYTPKEEYENTFLPDGNIATGDIGYVDDDGFLYLMGRIKELIVLSNGVKIHPSIIEEKLNNVKLIKQSVVFGNNMPYLKAIIVKQKQTTEEEILIEIRKLNKELSKNYQIKKVLCTDEPFSIENKLITSNLKLNRKEILKKYESFVTKD